MWHQEVFEEKQEHHRRKSKTQGDQQLDQKNKEAKQTWIKEQCSDVEGYLANSNTKEAFQLVKDLTKEKHSKVSTIQDKDGNCLTEEKDVIN